MESENEPKTLEELVNDLKDSIDSLIQDLPLNTPHQIPKNLVSQGLVFFNFLGGFTPKKELPIPEGDLPTLGDDFFKGVQL